MNYLAHLFLAKQNRNLMTGSYLGDFVKGELNGEYSPEITRGIRLHRRIDSLTDSHPIHKMHRSLFSDERRRYSGVILDIAYDHFLSINWSLFTHESKADFIQNCYKILSEQRQTFPFRAQQFLRYMLIEDVLNQYHDMKGIELTLNRLAHRGRTHPKLINSHEEIARNYSVINAGFITLFSDIQKWIST